LLPNRQLVLWQYTRWNDPRLEIGDALIVFHGKAGLPACKIGFLNQQGWLGYDDGEILFLKYFEPSADLLHPDFNCNAEVYRNDRFIELETLAPLVRLEPGEIVSHDERWEICVGAASRDKLDQLGVKSLSSSAQVGTTSDS
jgi:hypothetical protein